jgi:hypothetical protein
MSIHLTPQLIVEAIDGTLASAARDHLSACGECRAEVDRVRVILREAERAAPAREPSPLFWDHFADRVREATSTLPVASRSSGWTHWLRPALLVGGALAVIALVVAAPRLLPPAPAGDEVLAVADPAPGMDPDIEGWDLVVSLTDDLGWDEVQQVARPRRGVADAMIDELSPAERAMFVKLLKQEMGGLE